MTYAGKNFPRAWIGSIIVWHLSIWDSWTSFSKARLEEKVKYFFFVAVNFNLFKLLDGEIIEEDLEIDLEPLLEESMEMEEENPFLELSDDLNNLQNRIPAYKKNRAIATQSLKPFTGYMCDICHRSFENEEYAQVKRFVVFDRADF